MSDSDTIVAFPDLKLIEEEAALWVARVDARDELSDAEKTALKEWASRSHHHREAIERMSALWGNLNILDDINYLDEDCVAADQPSTLYKTRWWTGAAIAASIAIAAITTSFMPFSTEIELPSHGQFVTAVGERELIKLADGSTISLNTNSEVSVNLTDKKRAIHLLKGEAYFDVAHDPTRPFTVKARGGIVKAVGTAFSVFLREKAVEVTVSEGVVALIPQSEENFPDTDSTDETQAPLAALTAGQSALFTKEVESLSRISPDALDRKLLWREGFIAFAGEPLSTVVEDVSRYTDIVIEIDDPSLETLPVGGYFRVGEVEGMLASLETSFGVRVERISPSFVRLSLQ